MRILAVSNGHLGHVSGIYGLLRHAASRGHACEYVFRTPPAAQVRQLLGDAATTYLSNGDDENPVPDFAAVYRDRAAVGELAAAASDPLPLIVRQTERVIAAHGIDLVLTDGLVTWAVLAAAWAGVPYATVPAGFGPFFTQRVGPEFEAARALTGIRSRVFRRFGVDPHQWVQNYVVSPHANLIMTTEEFVGRSAARVPFEHRFVGPLLVDDYERLAKRQVPDSLPQEAFVFVCFGTMATGSRCVRVARQVVAACKRLGVPCVIATGNMPDEGQLGEYVYRHHVPQDAFLTRSAVFVNPGGMNSVNGAMLAGVPVLACPMYFDQYDTALLLREAKAGDSVDVDQATDDQVLAMLDRLLSDPRYRACARAVGDSYRSAGGATGAFDYLESRVRRSASVSGAQS
jgi:MGT family glycosyltransferase